MSERTVERTGERSVLVDALLGAVVSVVLSALPFSPLLGGGVAGYLHRTDGVKVGALSGLFAAIPLGAFAFLLVGFFTIVPVVVDAPRAAFALPVLVAVVFGLALLYAVVLSAVGGVVGEYVYRERLLR